MRSDKDIRNDVVAELNWEPSIRNEDIAVAVHDGVVTLAGIVDSYGQLHTAVRVIERVKGVKAIANELTVQLPSSWSRSDSELAHAAAQALDWHTEIPRERITATVAGGLEGAVDWQYQRSAAEAAVRPLFGAKGVTNLVTVNVRPQVSDVRERIVSALRRQAVVDAAGIMVEVHGETVTLRGTVRSFAEKRDAERAAWGAKGVSAVKNELLVEPLIPSLV